ncbi:nuclear transport factor 2 family protein [Singulisphaera rosea]
MTPGLVGRFIEGIGHAFRHGDPEFDRKKTEARRVGFVQEVYRNLALGKLEAAFDHLDDEVELEITGQSHFPFLGYWRGRAEVGEAIRKNFGMIEDQHPEVHTVVAQGDTVVVIARERGKLPSRQLFYDLQWVQLFTFRDDRVIRIREIVDGYSLTSY